jgi:hypothetical protein
MALFTPKKVVLNWYQYDAMFSIELLRSFALGIEKQAAESIVNYRSKRSEDGHQGLDDTAWDLENIFEEYFPSLQRRSALLTLWGVFEHNLDQLCLLYQSEKGFALSFSDLSGKGIDRSTSYLEKVAGLAGLKVSQEWNRIKMVQRIRNVIAHDDGRLRDHQGKSKNEIVADMKKLGFLQGEDEIVVAEGFLSEVIDGCDKYFRLIENAIHASQGFTPPDYKRR